MECRDVRCDLQHGMLCYRPWNEVQAQLRQQASSPQEHTLQITTILLTSNSFVALSNKLNVMGAACSRKRPIAMDKHTTSVVQPIDTRASISDDETGSLCDKCAGIDFDALAQRHRHLHREGEKVMVLASPSKLAASQCPLCRLFATVSPGKHTSLENKPFHLRAFSAYLTYAGMLAPHGLLKDSTLLGVVSTINRRSTAIRMSGSEVAARMVNESQASGLLFLEPQRIARDLSAFAVQRVELNFDLVIARQWLDYCRQNHSSTCVQPPNSRPRSLRLIDCTTRRIVQPSSWVKYAALSYVWGSQAPHEPRVLNAQDVLSKQPKSIEDSIQVTLTLGLNHVWIDRYCIDQENDREKHDQIQQMDAIYRSAELTIIAAAGDDPNHGLPGINGTPRMPQTTVHIGSHIITQTLPHPSATVAKSKWASRGW